ncbi:MAG: hypothetical protein KDB73_20455, partial [Planctomycetes bacterium]|nr:hypothetical protein [Planctomycetota bacterium]
MIFFKSFRRGTAWGSPQMSPNPVAVQLVLTAQNKIAQDYHAKPNIAKGADQFSRYPSARNHWLT